MIKMTDKCYYIPSVFLGNGRSYITLRVDPPLNKMVKNINYAKDFLAF